MSKELPDGCNFIAIIFWLLGIVAYINNLIDLFSCDFEAPFKEEIIHLVGVAIPPASFITCWY